MHVLYCQVAQADLDVLGAADLLGFFGAITGCIVCAAGHLLDQLCPGILHCIFKLNCTGNGDTIIDYLRIIVVLSMPVQMPYQCLQVLERMLTLPDEHVIYLRYPIRLL